MEKTSLRKLLIIFVVVCLFSAVSAAITFAKAPPRMTETTINVSTASELSNALTNAQPGDVITLADGNYSGHFVTTLSGTVGQPIILQGSRNAILDGSGTGYVFHLNGANYWHLVGFTITNGKKGIMTDHANNNVIDNVLIYNTIQEGIHFRNFSSNNIVQNSVIHSTGNSIDPTDQGYGEGIYVGSALSNWATVTGGTPDASDYNRIISNHIGPNVMAEAVDLKEGTTGGEVSGNCFDHAGISGVNAADSWMDIKGNNYQINNNIGVNTRVNTFLDGFQTHVILGGWGNNNTFHLNQAYAYATGWAINVKNSNTAGDTSVGNVVYDDNIAIGADAGLSNLTPVASGLTGTPMPTPNCPTSTPDVTAPTGTVTSTPMATMTITKTATSVPTLTYTSTLTPTQPLVIATATLTSAITQTPTKTATRTPLKIVATFQSLAAQDGWILESTENSGAGGTLDSTSTTFRLGDDATDKQYRGILHFDTSSLPDTAIVITSVTIKIKRLTSAGTTTNPFTTLGGLRVDLRKPYFGTTASLALGDFSAAATSATVATFGATPVTGAWYAATLNTAGINNINRTGSTQFRLQFALDDNDNMKADYFGFYTGNTSAISDRPQLTVTYYLP